MEHYERYAPVYDWKKLQNRKWPNNEITKAPIWCSVDLRDGNQALANPMTLQVKVEFFKFLVKLGFKEIEIGFPAASDTEYNLIPDDVTIQVLTQSREEIILKTFEALKGAKNAIVHLYNSTSTLQRKVVFNKNKEEVEKIATDGAKYMLEYVKNNKSDTNFTFEYSPESFTGTELDYAIHVINSVLDIWQGELLTKPIINLPATVECSTPNIFADQVEYVSSKIINRENVVLSIHAHNDRGTAVATSEMALLAGADRIEGTLFGNGERTGNSDILTIAMNMFSIGIDPKLDFSNINEVKRVYEECTAMEVSKRHPYAGELVFTAFSGSHQDAISKGKANSNNEHWEVPYLPIDPSDVGRDYEPIIRINSQSGKGGVCFILETEYGFKIPKQMQKDIGYYIKGISDKLERELSNDEILDYFTKEYINVKGDFELLSYSTTSIDESNTLLSVTLRKDNENIVKYATDDGQVEAFCKILKKIGFDFKLLHYSQDALESGDNVNSKAIAITYICIDINGKKIWAIGKSRSVTKSSLKAFVSAINKSNK